MVERGRSKDVQLIKAGSLSNIADVRNIFHAELGMLAEAMDAYSPGYSRALSEELSREESLSQRIMDEIEERNMSFQEYGLWQSKEMAGTYDKKLGQDFLKFTKSADQSIKDLKKLEESTSVDINKYVELYNSKLKEKE
jgi:hypothetical protein